MARFYASAGRVEQARGLAAEYERVVPAGLRRSDAFRHAADGDIALAEGRLQDALTLGRIMQELVFAPGACDAVVDAAKKAAIEDVGADGCAEPARVALIAFAKAKGPAGVESAAREAAVAELRKIDAAKSP